MTKVKRRQYEIVDIAPPIPSGDSYQIRVILYKEKPQDHVKVAQYIDVRAWYTNQKGVQYPTRNGVRFNVETWEQVNIAIENILKTVAKGRSHESIRLKKRLKRK